MNRRSDADWSEEISFGKPKRKKDKVRKKKSKFYKKSVNEMDGEGLLNLRKQEKVKKEKFKQRGEWDSDDDLLFEWRRTGRVNQDELKDSEDSEDSQESPDNSPE